MVLQCNNLTIFPIVEFFPFWTAKKVQYLSFFYIFTLLKLERGNDDTNGTVAGLCGPATFVMSVIGAEMMMEVMVCVSILLFTLTFFPFSPQLNFPLFFFFSNFVLVQLCYSVLENTRTAVHNLDLSVPILRVTSKLFFSFMIQTEKKFLYSLSFSFFPFYLLTIIYMSSILE